LSRLRAIEHDDIQRKRLMGKNNQGIGSDDTAGRDEAAIRKVIARFSEGIRDLDADQVSSIFHQEANSFSVTPSGICIEPHSAWPRIIKRARADSAHLFREPFTVRILNIDIAGTAATAKVEWKFESATIVDFYNMLKIEGNWLIVNQVYHVLPDSGAG
jgi:hypothetical protein